MTTILVVDDSSTDTYHYQKILEAHGYRVITATNGQEGIETAKMEKPEIILMDVVMPGINGFQATRQITRDPQTADIPVIIISNKDQESDRAWGLRQGARDYIVKCTSQDELLGKIRALLKVTG